MRNIAIVVSILLALLVSCTGGEAYYNISGSGVASGDTLYLYGLDRRYEYMDTIFADEDGTFDYDVYADTVFPMSLLMPTGEALVLFAEPAVAATVVPDSVQQGKWVVTGGQLQHVYDSMAARIEKLPIAKRYNEIDSFVRRDPMNEVNIMLWRRYLVESPTPDFRNIRNVSNLFGGRLNDDDFIVDFKEFADKKRSLATVIYSSVPVFNFVAMDDTTKISNARYRDKFLVLNFWASWDSLSCEHMKQMSSLYKRCKADEFMMLNVSLDHDTAQWRQKVLADSILGDNVCDLKMWDNVLVKRYDVSSLPYSVLVNPQLLNISYDTNPEKLDASLDSIMNVYKKNKETTEKRRKKKK